MVCYQTNVFHNKKYHKLKLWRDIFEEIDWNLKTEKTIGSVAVMMELNNIVKLKQDIVVKCDIHTS